MKIILLIMWLVLMYLNLYDLITTFIILEHGGTEANPIINWFIGKCGVIMGLLIPKLSALIFFTIVTKWVAGQSLQIRQKIVVFGSYMITICVYSYIMFYYNYAYVKAFGM